MISRTMIVAGVSMLGGLFTVFQVDLTEETRTALVDNIEAVIGGVLVIYGILMAGLRAITTSPLVTGAKGLLFKQDPPA